MHGHQERGRNGRQRPFEEPRRQAYRDDSAGGRSERYAEQRDREQAGAGYRAHDWERQPESYRNTRSEPHWDPSDPRQTRDRDAARSAPGERWRADDSFSEPSYYAGSRDDTGPLRYEPGGYPQGLRPAGARDWNSERDLREPRHTSELGQRLEDAGRRLVGKVKGLVRNPKNYKRSDERIREDVCDRLAVSAEVDPSEVEVNVSAGEVTLTGFVADRHMKFCVEDIADDVPGVHEIHNQLRVRRVQPSNTNAGAQPDTTTNPAGSRSSSGRSS
jgi:hypothetical protein